MIGDIEKDARDEIEINGVSWKPKVFLKDGIKRTYPWIKKQVEALSAHT